jgi:hypothetical protein
MSAWPQPHDVGSWTIVKRSACSKFRMIGDTITGQDPVDAGHKLFRNRPITRRDQTACYRRDTRSVVHDVESLCREAVTSGGVIHAALVHDLAKYLTDGETVTVMQVIQRSIARGIVSHRLLTHRAGQTGRGPDLPVSAPSGSSK